MDAKPLSIGKILSERQRFVVPIYQRTYAWTKRELEPFFEQVRGKSDELLSSGRVAFSHYMGALLLIPDADPVFGRIQAFNVVDGQQRLTTFHLCFAALRDVANHYDETATSAQLTDLILHSDNIPMRDPGTERFKLEPTAYDRPLFRDLIELDRPSLRTKYPNAFYKNGRLHPSAPEAMAAYWFFWDSADAYVTQDQSGDQTEPPNPTSIGRRLLALSTVLFEHFRLIVITLSADDDAQVIFETLNSGGKPLAAMDLVRNDVFHRAAKRGEDQEKLLTGFWSVFEKPFWKQDVVQGRIRKPRIDFFLGHALAAEQGKPISLGELFAEYKSFVTTSMFNDTAGELAVLTKYAPIYAALIEPSGDAALARLARRLAAFDVSTAYPLVLTVAASDACSEDKDRLYDLIASYVVRRALCYLPTANYNNTFVDVAATFKRTGVSEAAFSNYFGTKTGDTVRFPSDGELEAAIRTRPQYGWLAQPRLRLILEELEFAARDKFNVNGSLQDGLSIEHVMPQSWVANWPLRSGVRVPIDETVIVDEAVRAEAQERNALINILPNLTLLTPAANSSASNSAFEAKRVRLNESLLKTNVTIAAEAAWDEDAMARRADIIVRLAPRLWPAPASPTEHI
ncbi:hypothetical protein ASG67_14115 [Sphingomonas sp. Leaf339]|uniref:DUF262 domain-containing protein n=1 Tax=Sphingomonas sp. Leaf339 TaxID=1736343 RepID=UPI0006F83255|nr:DUF262 domain-containing protein [Sphingomonas sp. Leaf339]KQU47392.1 hypothetical protein ASG67_14115 [Sphingomonas sp. Leaf339]